MQQKIKLLWQIWSPMLMFIGCYAILAQFRPITWQPLVYGSLGLAAIQILIYKTTYRKRPDVLPITMLYFQMASILSMIFIGNLAPFEEAMLCVAVFMGPWTIVSLLKIFYAPLPPRHWEDNHNA